MSLSVSIFAAIVSIADFGAKTCDAGKCTQSFAAAIESVHREITKKLEDVFSITADKEQYEKKLEEIELANQNTAKMKKIYSAAAAVSAVLAVLFLIRMAVSFHYYFKRRAR